MTFACALSGLQSFVYDVDDAHAARRLRLRSSMLTLVPAVIALRLQQTDSGSRIHYLGGGRLLATARPDAAAALEPFLQEMYAWLARTSEGKLGLHWTGDRNAPADASLAALAESLAAAKWRAGRNGKWFAHVREPGVQENRTLGNEEWESDQGGRLARDAARIAGLREAPGGWPIGPVSLQLTEDKPDIGLRGRSASPLTVSIPLHTPRDPDGSTTELAHLANEGPGYPYLAAVKLDGDRVGTRMAEAMADPTGEAFRRTSDALSSFFGDDVPGLLEEEFPRIYLVYSGGDDLVATGHFDTVLRFACAVRERFAMQGLGTVSAGVCFFKPSWPILKAVEAADRELDRAKELRDALCAGGCRLSWQEAEQALAESDGLADAVAQGEINRGTLAMLRRLGAPFLASAAAAFAERRYHSVPQFVYARSRRDWKDDRLAPAVRTLFDSLCQSDQDWSRTALVATLAAWRTRQSQEEDEA